MIDKIKPPFNREYLLEKIADKLTDTALMEALIQCHYNMAYAQYDQLPDDQLILAAAEILKK